MGLITGVAEKWDGVIAQDAVDIFNVDQHSGGGIHGAGEGGVEGEEGGDCAKCGVAGEAVGVGGGGVGFGVVEAEAEFAGEFGEGVGHVGILYGMGIGYRGVEVGEGGFSLRASFHWPCEASGKITAGGRRATIVQSCCERLGWEGRAGGGQK